MLKKSDKSPFENAETNNLFGWFAETVKLQIRWFAETVELAKLLKCLKKALTLAPIWLPHWPACRWTISLIMQTLDELGAGGELKAGGGELGGLEWPAGVPPADCPSCPSLHHKPCPCRPSRGLPCITTRLNPTLLLSLSAPAKPIPIAKSTTKNPGGWCAFWW